MNWTFKYRDTSRIEESIMTSDGKNLSTVIKGITFKGDDFDSLKVKESSVYDTHQFTFCRDYLCNCELECIIPVSVYFKGELIEGVIVMILELGKPLNNGALDKEILTLVLNYASYKIESSGRSGLFEGELLDLQKQLPEDIYIRTCFNCLYSDYSPYGQGLFGTMMCFKNIKEEYLKVNSKDEFFNIHEDYDKLVQETFLCEEFKRRTDGTGYRG